MFHSCANVGHWYLLLTLQRITTCVYFVEIETLSLHEIETLSLHEIVPSFQLKTLPFLPLQSFY